MTLEELDKRILERKQEQLALSTSYERWQEEMNRARIRFAQLTGAINELQELKKSLNGSEPLPSESLPPRP